jgi:hypothetical protein
MDEYQIVELALQRMGEPPYLQLLPRIRTGFQIFMGIFPICILIVFPIVLLAYSLGAMGDPAQEANAPVLSTVFSSIMLVTCIIFICFQHHETYEFLCIFVEIYLRFNIFHLIVCGSFAVYIKNKGEYSTYYLWIQITTIPMLIVILIPVLIAIHNLGR